MIRSISLHSEVSREKVGGKDSFEFERGQRAQYGLQCFDPYLNFNFQDAYVQGYNS